MTDAPVPTHEAAEVVFEKHLKPMLKSLPDGIAKREALRNAEIVADLAHDAIEEAPRT